ncbi:MAG: metal ABC transporter solute-binding protein, Zn/Mn family, partial [Bacteroidales bacterium]
MRHGVKVFALLMFLASCTATRPEGKKLVVVSILPQKYFVEQIAGNDLEIEVLVTPGSSHETYDLTPQQMAKVGEAVLWIKNGHLAFEEQWEPKFLSTNSAMKVVDWSEGLDLIKGEDHHHKEGIDPHYWLSPRQALV